METSDGIIGLKPGQLLRDVRPGVYRADNNELTLRPDQVTNDLAIARRLANQDQRTQAAIQQRLAAQPTAAAARGTNPQPQPAVQPSAPQEDPKVAARKELYRQRDVLAAEANRVATSLSAMSVRYGSWDGAAKKSPQAFQLLQQYNALQRQQADLEAQIAAIR